jgi:ureidoacrylate peracid hydrolase
VIDQYIPWEFQKDKVALLVIDMENDFVNKGAPMEVPMARKFLPNMQQILSACRSVDIPAIFTTHVLYDECEISPLEVAYNPMLRTKGMRAGTSGIDIVNELKPLPGETVLEKHRYDAFYNTRLETILRNIRGSGTVDTVIITGTVTSVCCESTARSAFMRDFKVAFVSDANGGIDEASHKATLSIISKNFGRIVSTKDLVRMIET